MFDELNSLLPLSEDDIVGDETLDDTVKTEKLNSILLRAASNGDVTKVNTLTEKYGEYIDLNTRDEDGSSPLIYAACFGHSALVDLLVQKGADINQKDEAGWSALFWSSTNNHDECAQILLQAGASLAIKSKSGRSLKEIVSKSSSSKRMSRILDGQQVNTEQEGAENDNCLEDEETYVNDDESSSDEEGDDCERSVESKFEWEKANWDQIYVFEDSSISFILKVVVNKLRPSKSPKQKPVSADILFLCLRYAHYYNSPELLLDFFNKAVDQIISTVQASRDDLNFVAYWITNSTQLLYYLKKDPGLLVATIELQYTLSELIQSLCTVLIKDVEMRIGAILDAAILDYNSIESAQPKFEGIIESYSRQGGLLRWGSNLTSGLSRKPGISRQSSNSGSSSAKTAYHVTPKTVLSLFSSTLNVLVRNNVAESIIYQIFSQIYYFVGAESFNRILTNSAFCCRTRGTQIRLNISALEEFLRENWQLFPASKAPLSKYLMPTVHLTQFLQVLTSLEDLDGFLETIEALDEITLPQVKLALGLYKYEVGEESITTKIMEYVDKQVAEIKSSSGGDDGDESVDSKRELFDITFQLPFKIPCLDDENGVEALAGAKPGIWRRTPRISDRVLEMLDSRKV